MSQRVLLFGAVATLAVVIACGGGEKGNPVSPSSSAAGGADAGAGGETLKVTAPTLKSPANGARLEAFGPTLDVNPATAKFTTNVPLAHRFQILNGSTVIAEFRTSGTTWVVDANLNENTSYGWRARGEQGGAFGPWSDTWTFTTPEQPEGYIRGNELYDPLFNGRTVGQIVGPVTFIPGVGAKIEGPASYIQYNLPQTLTGGEFSILVTNMRTNTEGDKTKVMAMAEGDADITTNDRRFTIEKRGNPPGTIAWRVLTSNQQIDTVGAERVRREFDPNQTYFWRASWGNNRFDLLIKNGGVNGNTIYSFGKNYRGVYDPNPHRAYIGGPAGRAGLDSGSVDGMIVRQVWISSRPRPSFANK
jgi:hypothetical protein